MHKASAERIVLNVIDDDKQIKIQLKKWLPTVEEYGVPYIEFKNNSQVFLLKLKDMSSVYLRSASDEDFELLLHYWDRLALYCSKNRNYFLNLIIEVQSILDCWVPDPKNSLTLLLLISQ